MPKVVAMAHAQQPESFDPLLPVELALPFPGHWGRITAVYSVAAVMDMADRWKALVADIQQQAVEADARAAAAETDEDQRAALIAQRAVRRALNLRIIGACVDRFTWPFAGGAPDPQDAEAFGQWPDVVLNWLAEGALQEVRKRVDDPKLWTGSPAT
jgi:hypothetical protein